MLNYLCVKLSIATVLIVDGRNAFIIIECRTCRQSTVIFPISHRDLAEHHCQLAQLMTINLRTVTTLHTHTPV